MQSWQKWNTWQGGDRRRRRPNRTAAERREQARRSQARVTQQLLAGFAALVSHRGCRPTQMGMALRRALEALEHDQHSEEQYGKDPHYRDLHSWHMSAEAAESLAASRRSHEERLEDILRRFGEARRQAEAARAAPATEKAAEEPAATGTSEVQPAEAAPAEQQPY